MKPQVDWDMVEKTKRMLREAQNPSMPGIRYAYLSLKDLQAEKKHKQRVQKALEGSGQR